MAKKGTKPKSSSELPEPFTRGACQRLRRLAGHRNTTITEKKKAIEARDKVEDDIQKCSDGETKKKDRLKADYYDWVHKIQDCNNNLKYFENLIIETIEQGDDLELIETIDPDPTFEDLIDERENNEKVVKDATASKQPALVG